jgi:urate oxidase
VSSSLRGLNHGDFPMPVVLTRNAYGKSIVRLTKVTRRSDHHDLIDWSIDIQLEGDFDAAYVHGDNRQVIATDTMKNTVYVLARDHELKSPEAFAVLLAGHFLRRYSHVSAATAAIREQGWQRINVDGRPHPYAFVGQGPEQRTCQASLSRSSLRLTGGIDGLLVLKTTDSAFRDFHRDELRTLPDADDRIMATELNAAWEYASTSVDSDACHEVLRRTLLEGFAQHKSLGVQHTLYALGEAALSACDAIDEITLVMPNRHRLLVNLAPFQRDNANQVFVATDQPHGLISGTVRRKPA